MELLAQTAARRRRVVAVVLGDAASCLSNMRAAVFEE
jgi:hypothetical protein